MSDFNSNNHHSILVSISVIIINALEFYGLDYRPIIEEAGFDADKTYIVTERVPASKIKKLWELSVQYTGDPCFGLTYARYMQPSALHGLGFSWLASDSLKEGLMRLVRFQKILGTHMALKLRETATGYCLYESISQKNNPLQLTDARHDAAMASVYKICQIMMGPNIIPLRVLFEHAKPACSDKFDQFFDIPVQFNANETAIEFDKQLCERQTVTANPDLTRINDQIVIDYLDQFEQDDLITQIKTFIIEHLPSGLPKQAVIASELNLSLRNFQRKLANANTCYSELLQQLRYEMACQYLKSSQYQIIEIAYLLGFTDPSNFGRAFKRWNGLSPYHYRQKELNNKLNTS